jgi:hypothetical protein
MTDIIRIIIITFIIILAWTAYEHGKPWVDQHGVVGLLEATETNLHKAWKSVVNTTSDVVKDFEKNHKDLMCGTKGC